MGFEEVISLDADITYSLGKLNKKTGKTDPKTAEGYYLGNRTVEGGKYGKSVLHFLKTPKGNLGVWGSGDLNKKLGNVSVGTMVKIEFTGMKPTPRGDMRSFKVSQDKENTIEVEISASAPAYEDELENNESDTGYSYEGGGQGDDGDDYEEPTETPLAAAPATNGTTAAERQARVQALLKSKAKK